MTTSHDRWTPPTGRYNAAADLIDRHLATRADHAAFIDPTRTLNYRDLHDRSARFAAALHLLGVRREQRVILIMLDTIDFPVAFWGAIRAGIVAVPLNTMLTAEQWRFMIEDSRATAAVVSAGLLERAAPVLDQIRATRSLQVIVAGGAAPAGTIGFDALLDATPPKPAPADTHADEVAFWLYTSGSTGQPKGARHIHTSPLATAELFGQRILGIGPDDVMFSAAKLFFAYGLGNGMSLPMSVGATTILLPDRATPDLVLATIAAHQPTIFGGVPTLYAALLAAPALQAGAGSKRLQTCISAGEALPEEIGRRWRERVGVDILDGIGSTEMLHIFLCNRPGEVRYGSTGRPVPGYEARIIDEHGHPAPVGEIGELVVKGPSAAEGYWNQRDKSRRTFVGEWTHTGDKFRIDAEGFYYYCGRTDDMFKTSGIWVSPFEVESALISHPAVLEAAVVGHEDIDGLTKPKAFVVLKPGIEPDDALFAELREHVKTTAGPGKYPRWIDVLDELPKTATGKIQRFKLRPPKNEIP